MSLASKESKVSEIKMTGYSENVEEKIERICKRYAPERISSCKEELKQKERQPDTQTIEECNVEKKYKQKQHLQQQQQQVLQQQHQRWQERSNEMCKSEKQLCKEEFKLCEKKMTEEGLSRP